MDQPLIHIVDDDEAIRTALQRLFRSVGLEACGYGSAAEFLEADHASRPGCLVTDIRLPGLNGLELQRRMVDLNIGLPVIVMTGFGDIPMSVQAMKAGAIDFLPKPFRDQDMLDATSAAIERDRASRLERDERRRLEDQLETLTARERQVLVGVAAGRLNKQIAADLGLSEVTVKIHRGTLMRKMCAANAAELVRIAGRLGLTPDTPVGF